MKFIGRRDELSALNREYTNGHGFVVIYGRRRIGKTTLIKEFIKNKKALYFLADMESERQNMNKLTSKIADFTGQSYLSNVRFDTWQKLFAVFADNYPEQQKILVIDEFQYLVQSNPAFPSVFQEVWDELFKEKNIMVILCGSHISMMMSEVLSHSSPLYGRRTAQIRLQPLKYLEFSQAFPEHSFENRMMIYSVTGGVPKYMEFFCNDQTFEENIRSNVLNKSGFLYEEPLFLLEKEVREPLSYFSIMKAISMGNHKLSDISTVLESKSNALSPYLSTLIGLFLLEKRVPVTEKEPEKSRKGLYYISDTFMDFWFRFVYPFRSDLELDNIDYVMEKIRANLVDNHVSFVYERVCAEIFAYLCREKSIDFHITKIGSFWNSDKEIDVVAIDQHTKTIFAGECKFHHEPVDMRVYAALKEKCDRIPEFNGYHIKYGLFSKSGFEKRVIELSKQNKDLMLINEEGLLT